MCEEYRLVQAKLEAERKLADAASFNRVTMRRATAGGGRPRQPQQAVPAVLRGPLADWAEGGAAAIKMMRIEKPAEYVASDVRRFCQRN